MIEIKHRTTGEIIHTLDAESLEAENLSGLDLSGAYLMDANLMLADLTGTNLTSADLGFANLYEACLDDAILCNATLSYAHITEANLRNADLSGADLIGVDFTWSDLTGANFANAICTRTLFTGCSSLRHAKGLESIRHRIYSFLDAVTLRACVNDLPDVFLRGVGYNDEEIATLRDMYKPGGIAYYSCFLSSAEADLPFVTRLYNDLQANGVTCWHYKENMRGGLDWKPQINEAIKFHDKLVLICSRRSVYRENVVHEIIQAIESERETGNKKLFPIRLDNHIFSDAMMEEAREMVATQRWRENWVVHIKRKHVPDFSTWETTADYDKEFQNLLRDLKQPAKQ